VEIMVVAIDALLKDVKNLLYVQQSSVVLMVVAFYALLKDVTN
jgi:hypothetical protein